MKDYSKLFGKDVIVAHRLMKNDVPSEEYALFTDQVMQACSTWVNVQEIAWSEPEAGEGAYDFGAVSYCYLSLDALVEHVPEPTIEDYGLQGQTTAVVTHDALLDAPIDMAFNVVSDLAIRHEWLVGLKDSDMLNSKITQHGATHRCVIKGDESDPFIITHSFEAGQDYIAFTDSNQKQGVDAVFTLLKVSETQCRLRIHYLIKRNFFKELLIKLTMKKKLTANLKASCERLNDYCTNLIAENRQHEVRIVLHPAATPQPIAA